METPERAQQTFTDSLAALRPLLLPAIIPELALLAALSLLVVLEYRAAAGVITPVLPDTTAALGTRAVAAVMVLTGETGNLLFL
jgi:hypothetical protein